MGIPIQSDNMRLVLANGKGSEFFVRSMVLDEGLGIIPTARLELCSSEPGSVVEMDKLKGYLGLAATVEFKHLNVEDNGGLQEVSTRWMSGQVSSVEHLGVIDARNDGSEPVCGYRMTIRPSLAKLCLRRSRYQIANSTARKVLEALLDSCCKGEYAFPGQDCPVLDATRDFSQGDETDYEFFVRVLASCGLSYHCQMNKAESLPTAPKLHIINALPSREQLSELETNYVSADDSKVTLCYKHPMLDGCLGSMTAWEMSQSDGVKGCSVSFGDAGGTRLSGGEVGTDENDVVRLNHVPFDNIRSSDEVKREVGVFLKSMRRNDGVWLGVTRRLEARVGASLVLRGFYGRSGSDIKDLVIARTRVRLESPIPTGQLGPWGSAGWRQYVSVGCISTAADAVTDFSALPTGRIGENEAFGGDRASGDFSNVEKTVSSSQGTGGGSRVQVNVEEDWRKAAGTTDAWQSTTMLVQATVCAPGGSTDSTNNTSALRKRKVSDTEEAVFYEFLAKPDGADGVMVVRYVQPVGGLGQGLFRVPRIGDRILVARCSPSGASVGGISYLMGYLPGDDMQFTTNEELKRADGTALPHEMMSLRFRSPGKVDKSKDSEMAQPVSIRRNETDNVCSEIGFYNTHVGKNLDKDFKESDDDGKKVLANFQSSGNMQLTANDRLELNAKNMHLCSAGRSGWKKNGDDLKMDPCTGNLLINDFNKVLIDVKRSITLKVGRNYITISQNGISIRSLKRTETGGPMDSYIYMDAISGTSIGGMSCSMTGFMGVDLNDRLGGSVSVGCGSASMTGVSASVNTFTLSPFVTNVILATKDIFSQIAGFENSASTDVSNNVWVAQSTIDTAVEFWRIIRDFRAFDKLTKTEGKDVVKLLLNIFKMLTILVDLVRIGIEAKHDDWMSQPVDFGAGRDGADGSGEDEGRDYMTNRDAFRYAVLSTKAAYMLVDFVGTCIAMGTTEDLNVMKATSLTMRQGTLELETSKYEVLSVKKESCQTALAGFP